MSGTDAMIFVRTPEQAYKAVWVRYDGYPSGVGRTLVEHYNSQELAEALVAPGSMHSIGPKIDSPDEKERTRYLARDEGHDHPSSLMKVGADITELRQSFKLSPTYYAYLWDGTKWRVGDYELNYLADVQEALLAADRLAANGYV